MEKKNEEDDGDTSGEYTSEDDGYVWPDGTRRRTREEWARYHKQVEESEGFDVDLFLGTSEHGFTALTNFDDDDIIECTKAAIEHFNKENDASFRFVKIEKTTCLVVAGFWYYITFQAIDGEANLKIFQTITFYGLDHSIKIDLCRLKPGAT
uniref:Cystatin domain-containing protein n=1 Tax=Ananas comosus var. bracteatus TaxID=296719 RepID=A0A6V7P3Q9_ANACO|nr:unnamed protein product [Ananas comosus var. bracteatus]